MSLKRFFKRAEKALRPLGKVIEAGVSTLPGGAAAVALRRTAVTAKQAMNVANKRELRAADWGSGALNLTQRGYGSQPMSLLPALAGAGSAILRGGGAVAGRVKRGTVIPGMGTVGTVVTGATVGGMVYDAMGNPVRRRRRSKGITASQLKAFTRVTSILNKYCKTPAPMKRRAASRSKSCR